MHFCINFFIFTICAVTLILFTEVFPKSVKLALTLIGSYCFSYAGVILVKKIGEWSGWYSQPIIFPYVYYTFAGVLVIVFIGYLLLKRKKA